MARMNESKKEAVKDVAPRKKRFNRQDENGRTDWDTISRQVCIFVACVYIYIFVYIHIIIYCMCIYIYTYLRVLYIILNIHINISIQMHIVHMIICMQVLFSFRIFLFMDVYFVFTHQSRCITLHHFTSHHISCYLTFV